MMITFYSLIYLLVLTNVFNHSVSIVSNDHNLNNIALISDQKAFINLGSDILIRCDLGIDESIFVIEKHHLDDLKHLIQKSIVHTDRRHLGWSKQGITDQIDNQEKLFAVNKSCLVIKNLKHHDQGYYSCFYSAHWFPELPRTLIESFWFALRSKFENQISFFEQVRHLSCAGTWPFDHICTLGHRFHIITTTPKLSRKIKLLKKDFPDCYFVGTSHEIYAQPIISKHGTYFGLILLIIMLFITLLVVIFVTSLIKKGQLSELDKYFEPGYIKSIASQKLDGYRKPKSVFQVEELEDEHLDELESKIEAESDEDKEWKEFKRIPSDLKHQFSNSEKSVCEEGQLKQRRKSKQYPTTSLDECVSQKLIDKTNLFQEPESIEVSDVKSIRSNLNEKRLEEKIGEKVEQARFVSQDIKVNDQELMSIKDIRVLDGRRPNLKDASDLNLEGKERVLSSLQGSKLSQETVSKEKAVTSEIEDDDVIFKRVEKLLKNEDTIVAKKESVTESEEGETKSKDLVFVTTSEDEEEKKDKKSEVTKAKFEAKAEAEAESVKVSVKKKAKEDRKPSFDSTVNGKKSADYSLRGHVDLMRKNKSIYSSTAQFTLPPKYVNKPFKVIIETPAPKNAEQNSEYVF